MKHIKITILFFLVGITIAQAQLKEWGLKGGIQSARFTGNDFYGKIPNSGATEQVVTSDKGVLGYTIGAYVRGAESVFLQGEALLSIKGAQLDRMAASGKSSITLQYGQLDVPLSIGLRHKTVELTGGPLLSLHLFNDDNLNGFLSQYATSSRTFTPYRRTALGYHVGLGLNFNRIGIQARYAASIQNVTSAAITYPSNDPAQFSQSYFQQGFGALQVLLSYRIK